MKFPPEWFMKEALREAKKGYKKGEVPVGAVIVKDSKIIARAYSKVRTLKDPTAHAEILAIQKAAKKLKNERLNGCSIYVTVEPCAMCSGALILARVEKLIYGAAEPKTGGVKSVFKIASSKKLNHRLEVTGGVLEKECGELMKKFFRERRV
ncbi:MAG: tRNA-specific adenosine deaminase [Candidatus Firestonebacteria bacterium RIFOXYA2_FULL_40_8]|nr:MAG: tRNA-specific adenosine deaminase [Candidatus Firestonebacteria bacterium RIFOXYA2_FULL_40_8]